MDMEFFTAGSIEWCMLEMKRLLLIDACKKELIEFKYTPSQSNYCKHCRMPLHFDSVCSDIICKHCGIASRLVVNSNIWTFNDKKNYNRNCVHHYTPSEHFAQTLSDFADIGNRNVPTEVMNYCRTILGRGIHITSFQVFNVLQTHGYRSYYQYKYAITNRLRGRNEFYLSNEEVRCMRQVYNRYKIEFIPFQLQHNIGTTSKRGKPRVFWPIRFILARMCEEIGRSELVEFIRGISCIKRLKTYVVYWDKLKKSINDRYPPISFVKVDELQLQALGKKKDQRFSL
jgi:hypothetical protein